VKKILEIGVEKVSINTSAIENPQLITEIANSFGNQSVIVSIDVKKNFWGKSEVYKKRGMKSIDFDPVSFARKMEDAGAGELLITSIDKEGTWDGYDIDLLNSITSSVNIPVIANGGAGKLSDLKDAVKTGGASAVAMGSMVVYQKKGLGVLINFPKRDNLELLLN
jgi:cyclase